MLDKIRVSNHQPVQPVTHPRKSEDPESLTAEREMAQYQPSKEEMKKVVQGMNDFLYPSTIHVKFEFHDELEEYYVTMVDDQTQEIIREIPPKKLLDMYAAMTEYLGILIDKKV
ncbi:flagellar protein FlaG [Bacillus xiapuensis]|uniref:flagellar protein FlaG n=1 Tax=Bacillus xiapuensis TaxID=2014075 RepID=UPI000C23BF89|nr:flagellar protein FlaG [Bacillus xiapuensis]